MKNLFASFIRDDEGQDIIEYALLAAFISIVAYTLLGQIGTDVKTIYSTVGEGDLERRGQRAGCRFLKIATPQSCPRARSRSSLLRQPISPGGNSC